MEKSIYTEEYACLLRLVRQLRKDAGYTQVELARALGQSQSYISKIERGELRLDVIQLRSMCRALGAPFVEVVGTLERKLARQGARSKKKR